MFICNGWSSLTWISTILDSRVRAWKLIPLSTVRVYCNGTAQIYRGLAKPLFTEFKLGLLSVKLLFNHSRCAAMIYYRPALAFSFQRANLTGVLDTAADTHPSFGLVAKTAMPSLQRNRTRVLSLSD